MLCLNPKCRAVLTSYQWGEGYCSAECWQACLDKGATISESVHEATWNVTRFKNEDEIEAMLEAAKIDPRLPKIIYWRRAQVTYREIGRRMDCATMTVYNTLRKCTRKLLRRCGL